MRRIFALCLIAASTCTLAQTYRWTTPDGRTVISDTPPAGRQPARTLPAEGKGGGPSPALRNAVENHPVTLFTALNCEAECQKARDLLKGRGIPYTEKTLKSADEAAELKQLTGDHAVPTLRVGKQHVRGLDPGAYDSLLDLAGYPKAPPPGARPPEGQPPAPPPSP